MMQSKADIRLDYKTGDVIVLDSKGIEVFRKPKTEQTVSIANAIYMFHKHSNK